MFTLSDKVSLVTGATSGLGKAAALALARQGSKVVVSGRNEERGQAVVDQIKSAGGEALFVRADVTQEADVDQLFQATKKAYGKIDVVFLNSGVFRFAPLGEQTGQDLSEQLDTNVKGVYYGLRAVANHLTQGASVIVTSSTVAKIGMPGASAYSLTKGAINTLTSVAAIELAPKGIRVNAIAPGPIVTEGAEALMGGAEGMEQAMASMVPLGRIGKPEEVAAAAVFLASDEASYITGQILGVDGGIEAK